MEVIASWLMFAAGVLAGWFARDALATRHDRKRIQEQIDRVDLFLNRQRR